MKATQHVTQAIVLTRTNYGEADRIVTFLTPEFGKVSTIAKGVRKPKSKLAGGIELLSISDITYMGGNSSVHRLISSRLAKHYDAIGLDLDRTMLAYELITLLHKCTEDQVDPAYFHLLQCLFESLNDQALPMPLTEAWFLARLMAISGYTPNLRSDRQGEHLSETALYMFSFDDACLAPHPNGELGVSHIKYLRLLFADNTPEALSRVGGGTRLAAALLPLIRQMRKAYLLQ